VLFNDTIAKNIAYGYQAASREDIEKAAKLANAHDFIVSMTAWLSLAIIIIENSNSSRCSKTSIITPTGRSDIRCVKRTKCAVFCSDIEELMTHFIIHICILLQPWT